MTDGELQPSQLPRDIYQARLEALFIAGRSLDKIPQIGTEITEKQEKGAKKLLAVLAENYDSDARELLTTLETNGLPILANHRNTRTAASANF